MNNLTTIKNSILLIKQEGLKVTTYPMYGVHFLEFETTGIQVRDMKRIIEYLPVGAFITSAQNGSLCINTRLSIK